MIRIKNTVQRANKFDLWKKKKNRIYISSFSELIQKTSNMISEKYDERFA